MHIILIIYLGNPFCIVYDWKQIKEYQNLLKQGPIVAFNLLNCNSEYIGYSEIEKMAGLYNIHLRVGCFCNPGACQVFLG